jgi:hypothetical protein
VDWLYISSTTGIEPNLAKGQPAKFFKNLLKIYFLGSHFDLVIPGPPFLHMMTSENFPQIMEFLNIFFQ